MLHPHKSLQTAWNYAQIGLLIFPLMPLLGAICLLLAVVGTWRQQYKKIIRRPLNWVLAVLGVWLVFTSSLAFHPIDAGLGLFNFIPFFGVFAAFSALIQTPAQLRRLANIIVITSVPVVIIGLGQLFWGWASPAQWKEVLVWLGCDVAPQGNPPGRMASVFLYTNVLAGYLVIVFILALGLWIESLEKTGGEESGGSGFLSGGRNTNPKSRHFVGAREPRHLGGSKITPLRAFRGTPSPWWLQNPKFNCLFLGMAVVGNLVALILTNSRNAWAIAVCAALAFAVYQSWRWLIAGVSAIVGSVFWAAFGPAPIQQWLRQIIPSYFWQRLTDQLYPNRPHESLRTSQWQFAWQLTWQRPWTGWGLRNFNPLYEAQMHVWLGHPHNFFLMLTAETGIPATLVFCGWVGWIFYRGCKLLLNWSSRIKTAETPAKQQMSQDRLIFFSYLVALFACIIFNTADVSIFDLRLNLLVWLVLSAISGVVYHQRHFSYQLNSDLTDN